MNYEQAIKSKGLRLTNPRKDVYRFINASKNALSHADIELNFRKEYDRVTIYRTINTFIEVGLIHEILDTSGMKYAVCKSNCISHQHKDNHLHFKCSVCKKLECLYEIEIKSFKLPKNYNATSVNILIEGICSECKQS